MLTLLIAIVSALSMESMEQAKQDLPFAERLDLAYLSRRMATNARRPALIANSRRDPDPDETHPQFS